MPIPGDKDLTSASALFRDVRHARKLIEQETGCPPWQSDEIVKRGRVPEKLRSGVISVLRSLRDKFDERVRQLDAYIASLEAMDSAGGSRRHDRGEGGT